jgi:hypothetical protein
MDWSYAAPHGAASNVQNGSRPMKLLSGLLTLLTVVGGVVTIALTIHSLNADFYHFLPDGVRHFMTQYNWLRWVAAGVLVIAVLLNLVVGQRAKAARA